MLSIHVPVWSSNKLQLQDAGHLIVQKEAPCVRSNAGASCNGLSSSSNDPIMLSEDQAALQNGKNEWRRTSYFSVWSA